MEKKWNSGNNYFFIQLKTVSQIKTTTLILFRQTLFWQFPKLWKHGFTSLIQFLNQVYVCVYVCDTCLYEFHYWSKQTLTFLLKSRPLIQNVNSILGCIYALPLLFLWQAAWSARIFKISIITLIMEETIVIGFLMWNYYINLLPTKFQLTSFIF